MYKFLIIFNTVINVMLIVCSFLRYKKYRFSYGVHRSFKDNIICSISFFFGNNFSQKSFLTIVLRNAGKIEVQEKIERLMNPNYPNTKHDLRAMLSWCKEPDEIIKFKKNYSIVDEKYVGEIISKHLVEKRILLTVKQHKQIYG